MNIDLDIEIDEIQEDEIDSYTTYDIATYPSDLTLNVLKNMWDNKDISIPQFQRNYVWTINQASLLIESFLLGLPVPQAFFFIDNEHKNLVIDGQQRITSIVYYLNGFFGDENYQGKRQVFRLAGLNKKSPFHQKRFEDLEAKDQRKLLNSVLRVVNIRQMAPKDDSTAAFHIFERLNTGGTPLRPQEIRNCVFHGPIVEQLNLLNQNENWRNIIGRKNLDKHQRDVEFILRIFAFFENVEKYEKPMKEFLNNTMQKNKEANSENFITFKNNFEMACEKIVNFFDEKPFHVRGPINLASLDSAFTECVKNPGGDFKAASAKYKLLLGEEDFQNSIFFNTSDLIAVSFRMKAVQRMFL
ncbi:MAG: DUF262 domain-containing protein [Stappiaceae bacterium]